MPRSVKAYVVKDYAPILPQDIIRALGERSHVRQGTLIVFARTAKAASERLAEVGIRYSARELRPSDGSRIGVLAGWMGYDENSGDNEVFVTSLTGGTGNYVHVLGADGKRVLRVVEGLNRR